MVDLQARLEEFEREGFLVIPNALAPDQVERLRAGVERDFAEPDLVAAVYGGLQQIWRPMMFEHGPDFEEVVDNPRVLDLVEAILGADCHLIAMSALRTGPGEGIAFWHADEAVRFPRPKGVPLDPRIPHPVLCPQPQLLPVRRG